MPLAVVVNAICRGGVGLLAGWVAARQVGRIMDQTVRRLERLVEA